MNLRKKKLKQARWLLVSGIMLSSLGLTGCGVDSEEIYEAVKNDEDDLFSPSYLVGFLKNGDEYKLYYSYTSLCDNYCDYETGEKIGHYFGNIIYNDDDTPIYSSDQFISFKSLDENLDYTYDEALELTDEMFDTMFNNFSKNVKLGRNGFDVFEICDISTSEEFNIIGLRMEGNTIFNLESYKIEDYSKCIVNKVEHININSENTRDAFLKKFYTDYYPDRLAKLDITKTR